jgi:hypothetical protein
LKSPWVDIFVTPFKAKAAKSRLQAKSHAIGFTERRRKVSQTMGERCLIQLRHLCTELEVLPWQY